MTEPLLVVTAGLPGTGKTTLAGHLAVALGAAFLRIDAIETANIPLRHSLSVRSDRVAFCQTPGHEQFFDSPALVEAHERAL